MPIRASGTPIPESEMKEFNETGEWWLSEKMMRDEEVSYNKTT